MKHLKSYESVKPILDTSASMASSHDVLDRHLKYRVYIFEDGSGEVHNAVSNMIDFRFTNIEDFCEEYGLRNNVNKYNL